MTQATDVIRIRSFYFKHAGYTEE